MCAHYCVSWYPEPVFVTYSMPQEAKDLKPDTFILHFPLICHKSYCKNCIDGPAQFLSIS